MTKTLLRAVLFDVVGTLLRLREPVGATYARYFAAQGAAIPASRIDEAFARVLRAMPPMVFPDHDRERTRARERGWWRDVVHQTLRAADGSARISDFERCFDALFAHYGTPAAWMPMAEAAPTLDVLSARGLRLAVVSNFDHRLPALLETSGLRDRFAHVVLPSDVGAAKPDPRIFHAALHALGVSADEAVYVGDDPDDDHAGAASAGLRAVDVRRLATLARLPELLLGKESAG